MTNGLGNKREMQNATSGPPWRIVASGLQVRVRLTPKAAHDRVDGVDADGDEPLLKVRVRAVPEDGKANAALELLMAEWLGVPRRSADVTAGGKSRFKTVSVTGDGVVLARKAEAALALSAAQPSRKRK